MVSEEVTFQRNNFYVTTKEKVFFKCTIEYSECGVIVDYFMSVVTGFKGQTT